MNSVRLPAALRALALTLAFGLVTPGSPAAPEAFQVGPAQVDQLPGGKEADGIIGDFILRNDLVEAVISCDAPERRANMSTYYGTGITPGALYDLTLRGRHNDQITLFAPNNLRGRVSHVRVEKDGREGEAEVETYVSAALTDGLSVRHAYLLRDGWQGILIVTTVTNPTKQALPFSTVDQWRTVENVVKTGSTTVGDAVDPADKNGYAYRWFAGEGDGWTIPTTDEIQVGPGETITMARGLVVATSPVAALGTLASYVEPTAPITAYLRDSQGLAIASARVEFQFGDQWIPAYPDSRGKLAFPLPPREYAVRILDSGRPPLMTNVTLHPDQGASLTWELGPVSRISFNIRDDAGRSIPCKAQFLGTNGTAAVKLGPANRAHGCVDQYHSERGTFTVAIPPGDYHVVVTHGPEFSHIAQPVTLRPGETASMDGVLRRLVDTRGWVSTDFHNHSTPSGDNTCGTDDRLINLAAEHVEFAPTTEHNRLYDWTPHIERLGLSSEIATVPGIELTGSGPHLNAFPFQPVPRTQDGGAPRWQKDPRINAIALRDFQGYRPERWVQVNHPDMIENFFDRNGDGRADGGYVGLTSHLDGAEVWDLQILGDSPYAIGKAANGREIVQPQREFIWLQLLNQGHRLVCVAVSDAHSVYGNGVGGWRTYVPSSTDDPARIDWKEITRNAKAGRLMVTTGPFLQVTAEDGTLPGGSTRAQGSIKLRVTVQCTDWIDIDRIQILVNGRKAPHLNFTRASHPDWFSSGRVKFDRDLEVPLSQDAHLIVVAYGENSDLFTGFSTSTQGKWKPCAYHQPIYVDVNGDGFHSNGDTLGWELPVRRVDVTEVRKMMSDRGLR